MPRYTITIIELETPSQKAQRTKIQEAVSRPELFGEPEPFQVFNCWGDSPEEAEKSLLRKMSAVPHKVLETVETNRDEEGLHPGLIILIILVALILLAGLIDKYA